MVGGEDPSLHTPDSSPRTANACLVSVMTFGMTMMQWWCVTIWNWIPHGPWPQEKVPLVTGELFTSWMMFIARDQKRNWSIVRINISNFVIRRDGIILVISCLLWPEKTILTKYVFSGSPEGETNPVC